MERISKYLDYNSGLDREDILKEIKHFSGYFYPFNWSLKSGHRYKTLFKTFTNSFLLATVFIFYLFTLPKAIVFDTAYACEITLIFCYMGYPLIMCRSNLVSRRSLCTIYGLIIQGFFDYEDVHREEQIKERDRVNRNWIFCRKIVNILFLLFPSILVFLVIDNNKRDPKSLPDWFNPKLPVPVWLPVNTANPIIFLFILIFQLYITVFFTFSMKSHFLCILKVCLTAVCEIKLITKEIRQNERKAVRNHAEIHNSVGCSTDRRIIDRVQLYRKETFRAIYQKRLKKIIRHHQLIVKYINCINDVYGYDVAYTEYLTGLGLAIYIHIILNDKNSWSLRIFSLLPLIGIYIYIAVFCIIGQTITDQLSDLHEEIYMSPWIYADRDFKKLMMIFQNKTLKPIFIKSSFSGTQLNLAFMITITKACYTMINFLFIMKRG